MTGRDHFLVVILFLFLLERISLKAGFTIILFEHSSDNSN